MQNLLRFLAVLACASMFRPAQAQHSIARSSRISYVVPQARPWNSPPATGIVTLSAAEARVKVAGQVATTTVDFILTNVFNTRVESVLVIPVPEGAILRGFDFQGGAKESAAKLLTKEEARKTYDEVVSKMRDPALLEFVGCNLVQSSVFPVEAHAGQRVRLVYEQLLKADGTRVDYVLPRSESLDCVAPWKVEVSVNDSVPVATAYSPSHKIATERRGDRSLTVKLAPDAASAPGPFRLSWLRATEDIAASLIAYPDAKIGGGYFLLMAGLPAKAPAEQQKQKREVILVLDRSGSMSGEKLEQARAAALQLVESLEEGEAFNLIVFAESVDSFASAPVIKDATTMKAARKFLKELGVRGGTNLHDALAEALRARPTPGMLPLVLFLTDGLPTSGQTSERAIRDLALKSNPHERRLFTFGVGTDVNTALLDKLAYSTRATASFVLPGEDVEVKVGEVFARLRGPVLASPTLSSIGGGTASTEMNQDTYLSCAPLPKSSEQAGQSGVGNPLEGIVRDYRNGNPSASSSHVTRTRVHDMLPGTIPDLFEGDQLVVLGRYTGDAPLEFELNGRYFGTQRTFKFSFPLDKASVQNAFVPRLWASREIARLDDAVRDLGVDGQAASNDPKGKEFIDEIIRLSKEFGILTPYTSFLAMEGTDLNGTAVANRVRSNYGSAEMMKRYGLSSVSQEVNRSNQRDQIYLNSRNRQYDAEMNSVAVSTVQQVGNASFYRRNNRWVDVAASDRAKADPDRTIEVGSPEFAKLVDQLSREGRLGAFAMRGELLLKVGDETVLVK